MEKQVAIKLVETATRALNNSLSEAAKLGLQIDAKVFEDIGYTIDHKTEFPPKQIHIAISERLGEFV